MTLAATLMVVGGGKMGEALVAGLLRTGWAEPGAITVVEIDPARRAELAGPPSGRAWRVAEHRRRRRRPGRRARRGGGGGQAGRRRGGLQRPGRGAV